MFFRKSKSETLPMPKCQRQEALYLLLTNETVTRRQAMISVGILNFTAVISSLRKKNFPILSNPVKWCNKFGRDVKFYEYFIPEDEKETMREVYRLWVKYSK